MDLNQATKPAQGEEEQMKMTFLVGGTDVVGEGLA